MAKAPASRSRSSAPVLPVSNAFQRSISPSGRFCYTSGTAGMKTSSSAFASSSSSFSSPSPSYFQRSASPTRVSLVGSGSFASSVRFSIDNRAISPGRRLSVDQAVQKSISTAPGVGRRTCMCSTTTHPGSFRCSLHKGFNPGHNRSASSSPSNRLNARRSAMTNSLVRIGTVEGDLVKRALAALIRPSSHQQRRRADFQPRPSRLSRMSMADDL